MHVFEYPMKDWMKIFKDSDTVSQIFRDLDIISKYPVILGKSCDIKKLIWSKWHLKQTTKFYFLKECSTSYKSLKCKEQINSFNDTFYHWQPMDLMCPRHFSPPRNVLSHRQYCKASQRDIVHLTYLQPPAQTSIASSLDFWHSRF